MEAKATYSGSAQLWVDIFGELSYSSHSIPPKAEYLRTKIKTKTITCNKSDVLDSFENVFEPEIRKQPKNLREAACNIMLHHIAEPKSMATRFWGSGVPQFMVVMVPYCPEFVAVCVDSFDPTSCSISGSSLRVVISAEAIRNMM